MFQICGDNINVLFCEIIATLRSGYMVQDSFEFAQAVEGMMRQTLGISLDEKVCINFRMASVTSEIHHVQMKSLSLG